MISFLNLIELSALFLKFCHFLEDLKRNYLILILNILKNNFILNNSSNLNQEKPHQNHHHEKSLFPFPFSYLPLKILGSNRNLLVTTRLMRQFLFLSGFPLDFSNEFFGFGLLLSTFLLKLEMPLIQSFFFFLSMYLWMFRTH